MSETDIARTYGISRSTVAAWRVRNGWTRLPGAPEVPMARASQAALTAERRAARHAVSLDRLYRVFDRQVADLKRRVIRAGGESDEKDARALGTMARTLETLIALDRDAGAERSEAEPQDSDRIRAELARRIRGWAGTGEEG